MKASKLQYYKGKQSLHAKRYQRIKHYKKPGTKRKLSMENELLLTLMRLKLDLTQEYLSFLFHVSVSTVDSVLSTWIPFLAAELSLLIVWPSQVEVKQAYPDSFKKWNTV